jgi:AraC-like DNA-binding protein
VGDKQTRHEQDGEQPTVGYSLRAEFHAPLPQFDRCFTTFYHLALDVEDGALVHDYLQPEWGNIRFFCGSAPHASIGNSTLSDAHFAATGPSSLPCRFALGQSRMWGVGLLPLGWARFLDTDASAFANSLCDGASHPVFSRFASLSEVLCDPEATMQEQLAAITATMERLMKPHRDDAKISRVHEALVNGMHISVHDLADACAMSIRTLERVCRRHFGFSPKLLIRRQRFMRSLTTFMMHHGSRWTEAMDDHYHDQAQFTREFREFMTMNPSEYAALDHPILSSFMEARVRAWVSPAQTLDPPSR